MKHLKTETFEKIVKASCVLAELETGSRNQIKKEKETVIDLVKKYSKDCKRIPKEFLVVYTETANAGTSHNYGDYYTTYVVETFSNHGFKSMKETEKSYIFETVLGTKKVISKDRLLALVW